MDAAEGFKRSLTKALDTFSKAEICRLSGVARTNLDAYLTGSSIPGLVQADRIAGACGLTLIDFLRGAGVKRPAEKDISPAEALRVLTRLVREKT